MNNDYLQITVDLINDKVQFTGVAKNNPPITIDYIPPIGDGQGYTSLELFLISLASCSGTSVISLLRKMRKTVLGIKVNAKGIRREEHPTYFEKIFLEFIVNSDDITASDLQRALQLSEESICPVWGMVKNTVEIVSEYKIISSSGQ